MKREIITTDSYGRITIPSDTGNIWMNEMELVELFGVIAPTLRAAIHALPMVVALAFRIDTSGAATVRNALLERLCRRKEKQVLLVSMNNRMSNEC